MTNAQNTITVDSNLGTFEIRPKGDRFQVVEIGETIHTLHRPLPTLAAAMARVSELMQAEADCPEFPDLDF